METVGCNYNVGNRVVITLGATFTPEYKNLQERNESSHLDGLDLAIGATYTFE